MAEPVNFFQLIAHAAGRLPPVLVGTWIVMALLLIFGYAARRSLVTASDPTIPDEGVTLRHLAEVAVEWIDGLVTQVSELHGARRYVPFFGSLFLFILTANFMGLIPGSFTVTSQIAVTFALTAVVILTVIISGFARHGLGFLKLFVLDAPIYIAAPMALLEFIAFCARPISLSLRLFANMLAGHTMLQVMAGFVVALIGAGGVLSALSIAPMLLIIGLGALEILVAFLQAYVFAILSCIYLSEALHLHEHH